MTKQTTRRWIKRGVLALIAVGAVVAIAVALRPKPVLVDLATCGVQSLAVTVYEDGKTRVVDRFDVLAPTTGSMLRIELVEGDNVTEGQVLAQLTAITPLLDSRSRAEAAARVSSAQARVSQTNAQASRATTALEQAKQDLARQRGLFERQATSKVAVEQAEFEARARAQELSAARFAAKVATQEVAQAKAVLGLAKDKSTDALDVVAPTSGRILRVYRRDAGAVTGGARLLEVGDAGRLEVVVDVLTADAVRIEPGARVRIVQWGGADALAARVHRIEPSAFTRMSALGVEEQRVNVIIRFDEPPERLAALGDGYRVEAEIILSEGDVLAVPTSAVFRNGESWAVFRVRDGTAVLTPVTVGKRSDHLVEIAAGVSAGDVVVSHPGQAVRDGVRVAARGR